MSEQSFPFDFQRTPNFFSGFNNSFHLSDMSGVSGRFQFVFASYSPNNIEECLNGNMLDSSMVTVASTVDTKLIWHNDDEYIATKDDTVWEIGATNETLQAVFLIDKDTSFVMGYSIHPNPFNVTNQVIIRDGTVLWSFVDGN